MWKENCIIQPSGFLSIIQQIARKKDKDIFTGFAQNDMPEFLLFVIDSLHNSLTREVEITVTGNIVNKTDELALKSYNTLKRMYEKDYSEILDIFYGINICVIKNTKGETLSINPEPYMTLELSLPVKPNISLYDCFDYYISPDELSGDNAYKNEKTGKNEDANRTMTFWNFPNILVITLKRFNYNNTKKNDLVTFPLENLDLTKYVVGYDKKSYIYDCYAICNHMGGTGGGHYTSYVKNIDTWYLFNDNNVSKITNKNDLISPSAYCLFFRKKKTN